MFYFNNILYESRRKYALFIIFHVIVDTYVINFEIRENKEIMVT